MFHQTFAKLEPNEKVLLSQSEDKSPSFKKPSQREEVKHEPSQQVIPDIKARDDPLGGEQIIRREVDPQSIQQKQHPSNAKQFKKFPTSEALMTVSKQKE